MKIQFHSSVLFVKDIEVSRKYYMEYLDQKIEHDFGANILFESHLSLWELAEGHEITGVAGDPARGNTLELYFETEDLQESFKQVAASGSKMLHGIKTEPWGQMTFRFFDPDGHLLEIGESLATFISRIYRETGSIEETSGRTGVPPETIRKIVG